MKHVIHGGETKGNNHANDNACQSKHTAPTTKANSSDKQTPNMHESGTLKHKHMMPRPAATTKRPHKCQCEQTTCFCLHFSCPGLEAHSAPRTCPQDVRDNRLKQQPNPGPHGLTKAREDLSGITAGSETKHTSMMHNKMKQGETKNTNTKNQSQARHTINLIRAD